MSEKPFLNQNEEYDAAAWLSVLVGMAEWRPKSEYSKIQWMARLACNSPDLLYEELRYDIRKASVSGSGDFTTYEKIGVCDHDGAMTPSFSDGLFLLGSSAESHEVRHNTNFSRLLPHIKAIGSYLVHQHLNHFVIDRDRATETVNRSRRDARFYIEYYDN